MTVRFWREVEAEIVPDFQPDRHDADYNDWIALRLRHCHSVVSGEDANTRLRRGIAEASRILNRRKASLASSDEESSELDSLVASIRRFRFVLHSELVAPHLDRPNPTFFKSLLDGLQEPADNTRELLRNPLADRDETISRDDLKSTYGRTKSREIMDGLPTKLISFVWREIPQPRPSSIWNRVREFVYPHFIEEALSIPDYRAYLRFLIRRYGLGETEAVLKDVDSFAEERNGLQSSRTDTEMIVWGKIDDFISTLQNEKAQGWKYPPLGIEDDGPSNIDQPSRR